MCVDVKVWDVFGAVVSGEIPQHTTLTTLNPDTFKVCVDGLGAFIASPDA